MQIYFKGYLHNQVYLIRSNSNNANLRPIHWPWTLSSRRRRPSIPFLAGAPFPPLMQPCRPWGAHRPLAIANRPCHLSPEKPIEQVNAVKSGQMGARWSAGRQAAATRAACVRQWAPGRQATATFTRWATRGNGLRPTGSQPVAMGQNRHYSLETKVKLSKY